MFVSLFLVYFQLFTLINDEVLENDGKLVNVGIYDVEFDCDYYFV